jgi:ATP-dependent DNA helicase RecG
VTTTTELQAELVRARRIIDAERRAGCNDRVVVGGLLAFIGTWSAKLRSLGDPVAGAMADRVSDLLTGYSALSPTERDAKIALALETLDERVLAIRLDAGVAQVAVQAPPATAEPTRPRRPMVAAPPLPTPIFEVKAFRPADAKLVAKLGIRQFGDLLRHFPSRHESYPPARRAIDLLMQPVASMEGLVTEVDISRYPRGGLNKITAAIADATGSVHAVWFRRGNFSPVKAGQRVALSGPLTTVGRSMVFESPEWERLGDEPIHTRRMVPIYPLTTGLNERMLRERIKWAVDAHAPTLPDPLPDWVLAENDLLPLGQAIASVHFPDNDGELRRARRRLAFDELLAIQLSVVRRKNEWQGQPAPVLVGDDAGLAAVIDAQPYRLTGAQRRVIGELLADMHQPRPMTRLLQGEVGSGKTAVAAAVLFATVASGAQGSMMAPTEILAEQHYRSLTTFYAAAEPALTALGQRVPTVALLTGSVKGRARRAINEGIAAGQIDILVGTQAVIQETVEFANLGLAVVDEQHRFGVRQRMTLREKGGHPHLLVMTATPIPRTLALSLYGDLDLSMIDEMPPGRQKVRTILLESAERGLAYEKIRREAALGHQTFVICPLVEDSPNLEARAATAEHERLASGELSSLRLGLLHGRMKPIEKDSIMRAFRDKEFDVLVTTAVVEVGVDIPNATVMVIEGAERFGLAQLHQFRGRVGRGSLPSVCLLLCEETSEQVRERLETVANSSSGLELAEFDLRIRGPGDYFGVRQSGMPELRIATLDDTALVERARSAAERILAEDPELTGPTYAMLGQQLESFKERTAEPN